MPCPISGSAASASAKACSIRSDATAGWPSRAATRWLTAASKLGWFSTDDTTRLPSDGSAATAAFGFAPQPGPDRIESIEPGRGITGFYDGAP
jgi:hypothetical protein